MRTGSAIIAGVKSAPVRLDGPTGVSRLTVRTAGSVAQNSRSSVGLDAAELVVVDLDPLDAAVGGEDPGLGLDLLGDEHAADRAQHRVPVEELEVAGELLDAVDLAAALDLDGDGDAVAVPAEQVDRADVGRVLRGGPGASPSPRCVQLAASSSWRWASTPSFCRPGSTPSSQAESLSTSSSVIVSVSPLGLVTVHTSSPSTSRFGAFIQLSGL